jgi:hypothetical protein
MMDDGMMGCERGSACTAAGAEGQGRCPQDGCPRKTRDFAQRRNANGVGGGGREWRICEMVHASSGPSLPRVQRGAYVHVTGTSAVDRSWGSASAYPPACFPAFLSLSKTIFPRAREPHWNSVLAVLGYHIHPFLLTVALRPVLVPGRAAGKLRDRRTVPRVFVPVAASSPAYLEWRTSNEWQTQH